MFKRLFFVYNNSFILLWIPENNHLPPRKKQTNNLRLDQVNFIYLIYS